MLQSISEISFRVFIESGLIFFEAEYIIPFSVRDFLCDLPLAIHTMSLLNLVITDAMGCLLMYTMKSKTLEVSFENQL